MKTLVVIPCYFTGDINAPIFESVRSFREFLPEADICIVDSNSPDRSYLSDPNIEACKVIDAKNINFDCGAYYAGYRAYPKYDYYVCVHDSFSLKSLFQIRRKPFAPFRTFIGIDDIGGFKNLDGRKRAIKYIFSTPSVRRKLDAFGYDDEGQRTFVKSSCDSLGMAYPYGWKSIFGPMFTCSNDIMSFLCCELFSHILPATKGQQMAMERLLGIFLLNNLVPVCDPYMGDHFTTPLETDDFNKKIFNRQ
jgi:hypothetical protein